MSEADVLRAAGLEGALSPRLERIVDPPESGPRCLSPTEDPWIWHGEGCGGTRQPFPSPVIRRSR